MSRTLEHLVEQASQLPIAVQERLARQWLKDVEQQRAAQEERPQAGPESPGSAYDLVKGVAGSIRGPGDMSTNPEYLDDLGQRSLR